MDCDHCQYFVLSLQCKELMISLINIKLPHIHWGLIFCKDFFPHGMGFV